MKTATILLPTPILTPQGEVASATLREPSGGDFLALGDPYTVASTADGAMLPLEREDVIAAYLRRTLSPPLTMALVEASNLANVMALKDGLLRFFVEARTGSTSPAPQASSSSVTTS